MSKSNDKTDKRLIELYLVRQAHIQGIPIEFNNQEPDYEKVNQTANQTVIQEI